jgi:hypothetical protein
MKRVFYVAFGFLVLIVISLLYDGCQKEKEREKLINQLSEYQIENKVFRSERQKDSTLIVTQTQTIMSKDEAIKLGLLEIDKKIKDVESQLQAKINVIIKEKDIPFIPNGFADTSGWVRNDKGEIIRKDSISVPQDFALNEKWFQISGTVKKNGLKLDSLKLPSKFTVTQGNEKSGFLNLGRTPVVQVKIDNPYIDVSALSNIKVKKSKSIFRSPFFYFGVGIAGGILLGK